VNWQDAYELQMALWRFYQTANGRDWLAQGYAMNTEGLPPTSREPIRELYAGEHGRLIDCDPIFVSADMCQVVSYAKETFAPEALLETDVMTPRGFLMFETPFTVEDRYGKAVPIKAASWTRIFVADDPQTAEALRSTPAYHAPFEEDFEDEIKRLGAKPFGLGMTFYSVTRRENLPAAYHVPGTPAALPFHITPWYFGMTYEGNEVDELGNPTGAHTWWQLMQATFRLMQQKISVSHRYRPPRPLRREAKRWAFPDDRDVIVVRLRREESAPSEPSGKSANYSHRFFVGAASGGFWRNQWYPSISDHRQIWIDPYIKGDRSLPLIVKPRRAFQWSR
jgi:hypothetical protein